MSKFTAAHEAQRPEVMYALGATQAGLVLLLSIPAVISVISRARRESYKLIGETYEDEDGTASEESQKKFSTKWPQIIALLSCALGWSVAIVSLVLKIRYGNRAVIVDGSLRLATWGLLVFQGVGVFVERDPVACYNRGVTALISSGLVLANIVAVSLLCVHWQRPTSLLSKAFIATPALQAAMALKAFIAFGLIQRRPEVFAADSGPIDAELTVSLWNRLTYSWAVPLLTYAGKNKKLTLEDVPRLAHFLRSDTLQGNYYKEEVQGRPLWMEILIFFRWGLFLQTTLAGIVSVTQFLPQLIMFRLLQLLEQREKGQSIDMEAWYLIAGLFLAMLANSWIESYMFWVVTRVGVPVQNLLSTIIFMKSTRRKDVKGVKSAKKQIKKDADDDDLVIGLAAGLKDEDRVVDAKKEEEDDEADNAQKSRQNTINLVGVDAKRITDLSQYCWIFPSTAIRLVVSFTFLYKLVGLIPLLSGLAAFVATLPFNILFSKRYNGLQGTLMKLRDVKMAVITEALQGIRQIKFSALEGQWLERINQKRKEELDCLWSSMKWDTAIISIWIINPIGLAAAVLTAYALIHGALSASIAFTALAILGNIEMTLSVIPELTTDALEAWVSAERIEKYLRSPEKEDCLTKSDKIVFDDASIAWPADDVEDDPDRFVLRHINLEFPRKELSVISGKTGSGKSLLLAALLGEIDKMAGTIYMPKAIAPEERFDSKANAANWILEDSVAYAAQVPWIENATIKENVTFGLPVDADRYEKVVNACALKKDFELLEDGDMTDIGANGINLSGGQKSRVSFARLLYSRAGILILDDVFSAVDAHVGRQLYEEALTGELGQGRTRILVTHHVGLVMPRAKYAVSLSEEGSIAFAGNVDDLRQNGHMEELEQQEISKEEEEEAEKLAEETEGGEEQTETLKLIMSRRRSEASALVDAGAVAKKEPAKKFTEAEGRDTGRVKSSVYSAYFKASGGWAVWSPLVIIYLLSMVLPLARTYSVTVWTRSYQPEAGHGHVLANHVQYGASNQQQVFMSWNANSTTSAMKHHEASSKNNIWFFLGIYLALSAASVFIGTVKYLIAFYASIKASKSLFGEMAETVIRTPLRWLDTVPVGRVLNRFSSDFNQVDSRVANVLAFMLYRSLEVLGITIAAAIVSPWSLLLAAVLFVVVYLVASYYLAGAREIKRLESTAKSPIFEQFGSVLMGVSTVRAFDRVGDYNTRMFNKVDTYSRANYYNNLFNRWLGFQLNVLGAIFAFLVAAFIISQDIDASLAGFGLSFALQYTSAIISAIRGYSNLEMSFNATERVVEYTELKTEVQGGEKPPAAWPTEGRVEVRDLVAAYAEDLPPVLKGLSFTVEGHQRVGVVGRTGAGKSSLTLALFRFIPIRGGTVYIDGIDTSKIPLHDLRSRLAIIPQDPVLFSGTIRTNLDPFEEHTDAELYDALERVHLISGTGAPSRDPTLVANGSASGTATPSAANTERNTNIFTSLTSKISEGGLNLSQGQRQLLCLARAIVAHPRVMVLDEATSAVDMATDVLIQRSIREEFGDSTLLVIAHRLSTIADFDRILVMSEGKAVEYGSPRELLERKGVFADMVESSGEKEQLVRIIRA